MWTTDVLREEHRWILRMLQCLERLAHDSERQGRLDAGCAAELMSLFNYFADGLHQEREEFCLFPRLLARASCANERTDIGRLCGEHEEERRAMGRMNEALLGAIYGRTQSLGDFRREALRYAAVQRNHVLHENQGLLVLAERLLTPEDDEQVMNGFVRLEHEGPQKLKQVFERIQVLSARLGLETATTG